MIENSMFRAELWKNRLAELQRDRKEQESRGPAGHCSGVHVIEWKAQHIL